MFTSVEIVGITQDSVIGELRRTCGRGLGVKGPQVQILSSRLGQAAGQRPFPRRSGTASFLFLSLISTPSADQHPSLDDRLNAARDRVEDAAQVSAEDFDCTDDDDRDQGHHEALLNGRGAPVVQNPGALDLKLEKSRVHDVLPHVGTGSS